MQGDAGAVRGEDRGLLGPQAGIVGGGDLLADERLAAAAAAYCDIDGALRDAGVALPGGHGGVPGPPSTSHGWSRSSATHRCPGSHFASRLARSGTVVSKVAMPVAMPSA